MSAALVSPTLISYTFEVGGKESGSSVNAGIESHVVKTSCYETCNTYIRFSCSRTKEAIHESIAVLYKTIIDDKIHTELRVNSTGCSDKDVEGNCGNTRDALNECRCKELDRKLNWALRSEYENAVIARLEPLIKAGQLDINIAMYASAGLHSELVLVIKLLEKFKARFKGCINLFLIDLKFKDAILAGCKNSSKSLTQLNQFIGEKTDLEQFLTEIALSLPPAIKIEGAVFSNHIYYLKKAEIDEKFRFDLLVGSDIDNTAKEVIQLQEEGSRSILKGLVLTKYKQADKEVPMLCDVTDKLASHVLDPRKNSGASANTSAIAKDKAAF